MVAGLLDLRLESDRYLDLASERARAERLAAIAATTDVMGLATAYYAMTDEADDRRQRFLGGTSREAWFGAKRGGAAAEGGGVLEVGCGTGGLLVAAARAGIAVVGVDVASRGWSPLDGVSPTMASLFSFWPASADHSWPTAILIPSLLTAYSSIWTIPPGPSANGSARFDPGGRLLALVAQPLHANDRPTPGPLGAGLAAPPLASRIPAAPRPDRVAAPDAFRVRGMPLCGRRGARRGGG